MAPVATRTSPSSSASILELEVPVDDPAGMGELRHGVSAVRRRMPSSRRRLLLEDLGDHGVPSPPSSCCGKGDPFASSRPCRRSGRCWCSRSPVMIAFSPGRPAALARFEEQPASMSTPRCGRPSTWAVQTTPIPLAQDLDGVVVEAADVLRRRGHRRQGTVDKCAADRLHAFCRRALGLERPCRLVPLRSSRG